MGHLVDQLQATGTLSRRAFVGAGIAAAGAFALAGCSPTEQTPQGSGDEGEVEEEPLPIKDPELDPAVDGKWIPVACPFNCGGNCLNKAYVVDGVVVRQKTDDTHEDSFEYPQSRGCLRGRAQQQQCFNVDRLKYPMKRLHWEPLTGGDKSLRGRDEWVRISWDEAFQLVADEVKNIVEKYGNRAIFLPGYSGAELLPFFSLAGGAMTGNDTASFGTANFTVTRIGMPSIYPYKEHNDRFDLKNADTIVFYGCNPAWASGGNPCWNYMNAKEQGTSFVFVGPEYNVTASVFDAKWIRVRPGTDTAFLLAVAYQMFKTDDNGSVIDWDFLEKYTVGIDGDHMPADAKVQENFRSYLFGEYDGIEKTPEWASEIAGTPVEDIIWYADLMKKDNVLSVMYSYAPARCHDSENWLQLMLAISCMGGHIGKPGQSLGPGGYHIGAGRRGGAPLVQYGVDGLPAVPNPVDDCINVNQEWDAVFTGKYNMTGNSLGGVFTPEDIREVDIRMICHHSGASLQNVSGINRGIEAHRKVDFVLATGWHLSTQARYADIVLPITTFWEREGMSTAAAYGDIDPEIIMAYQKVTEPLYEAKSPQDVCKGLIEAYGLNPDDAYPISEHQQFFNRLASSQVINEENTGFEPLLTITQEDIDAWGVEGTPQEGRVSINEFLEKGIYQVERHDGDQYMYIAYKDFIDDPEANPRQTPSGKFEIYSQTKADDLNAVGYSKDYVWKPYPTYKPPLKGYEASFSDWENKVKGEYPFQVFNPHYLRRAHSQNNQLPWLREAFSNPVFLNASDAAEKGIEQGDTVRVYNEYGSILRIASLSERMMPGCVGVPHGSWVDLDEDGIDHGGADNILRGQELTGCGVSGYNTVLCNFEKWDGEPLLPDCEWEPRVVTYANEGGE